MLSRAVIISIDRAIEIAEEAGRNGVVPIIIPKELSREEKRGFIIKSAKESDCDNAE